METVVVSVGQERVPVAVDQSSPTRWGNQLNGNINLSVATIPQTWDCLAPLAGAIS